MLTSMTYMLPMPTLIVVLIRTSVGQHAHKSWMANYDRTHGREDTHVSVTIKTRSVDKLTSICVSLFFVINSDDMAIWHSSSLHLGRHDSLPKEIQRVYKLTKSRAHC